MSENATKKEITYHAPVVPYDEDNVVITSIGASAGAEDRYQIVWLIPADDDKAKERYDCTIKDLVEAGVRQLATRVNYQSVGFDDDGLLVDGGHEAMQEAADNYKVGARRTGSGRVTLKKAKAQADAATAVALQMAEKAGLSEAEVKEMIQAAQALND